MALIKTEPIDDSIQSTETDFPKVKSEPIEVDDSNIWALEEDGNCGPPGTSALVPVKSEPVDDSLENWDGCGVVIRKDEPESDNELENPLFVTVSEAPDDKALLDEESFLLNTNAQMSDPADQKNYVGMLKARFAALISGSGVNNAGQNEGSIADTNEMPRDDRSALVMSHSESPIYCHHCNAARAQKVNSEENFLESTPQCYCNMNLNMRSLTECEIPLGIVSTTEVEKITYERANEQGKAGQSKQIQRTQVEDEKSVDKNSGISLGKVAVCGSKKKQECPSLNLSSKLILQSHSSKTNHKCSQSEKTFNVKSNLASHTPIHQSEKPFKCNQCWMAFKHDRTLTIHMQLHAEKTFKCNDCETVFHRKKDLISHMREHAVKKTFKCYICERTFMETRNLMLHLKTHIYK